MLEHTNKTDNISGPDYDLDEDLMLTTPEQFKAIVGPVRPKILGLLAQRAATTSQIAEALDLSKGTTGHHIKVLESAGLVRVVRTRQVRALTEKYYGRMARTYRISTDDCAPGVSGITVPREVILDPLRQALSEFAPSDDDGDAYQFMIAHAQMRAADAREFALRLEALQNEFSSRALSGGKVYGFVAGVYPTNRPNLPQLTEQEETG